MAQTKSDSPSRMRQNPHDARTDTLRGWGSRCLALTPCEAILQRRSTVAPVAQGRVGEL